MRYFLLLIILFSINLRAQEDYRPFIEEGKTFAIKDWDGSLIWEIERVYKYRIGPDTLINDTTYNRIEKNMYSPIGGPPPFTIGSWYNTDMFVRENLESSQVYLRGYYDYDEFLLYDFSLEVGETITSPVTPVEDFAVISIEEINLLDGTLVKKFNFDFEFSYIEGVGGVMDTFGTFAHYLGGGSDLLCVDYNGELLFDWICGGYLLNTAESEQSQISLYPNPSSDFIKVESTGTVFRSYDVTNSTGQTLYSGTVNNGNLKIDISELADGLYYLRLIDSKGRSSIQKFVKE